MYHILVTYIFGAIAIKLATKLTDTYSLNSTVTLTPKIQRSSDKLSMSLEEMVRFARNKSSMNKLVDLFHIWPLPLIWPVTLAMNFQGQILKLPYFRNIWSHRKYVKECVFFGWVDILFVDNIRFTFCFNYMLQCRPNVTFLSMVTLVWSYHYCDGDCVYLRHNTS